MAYELYKDPLDQVQDILNEYDNKITVLKCDVQCRYGVFHKDTVVYVRKNKFSQNSGKAEIEMKIYDCSERNDLGDYEPYKTEDIYEIAVESNEELISVLDSIFAVNDEKTKYYKEYANLRQRVRNYSINGVYITDFIKSINFLSSLFLLILLVGTFKGETSEFISVCNFGIPILTTVVILCFALVYMTNFVVVRHTNKFEETANVIHAKIIAKSFAQTEICTTTVCHDDTL